MTKQERERQDLRKIIIILIFGLIFSICLILSMKTYFNYKTKEYQKSDKTQINLVYDKDIIKLKLPSLKKLSKTQNPILIYDIEKLTDGSEIEIYTQKKDYKSIKNKKLNKIGIILSDETNITFELYNTKEKNPLRVVSNTNTFDYNDKKITYGGYNSSETDYYYYLTVSISKNTSILISINSTHKMLESDFTNILDWIQF